MFRMSIPSEKRRHVRANPAPHMTMAPRKALKETGIEIKHGNNSSLKSKSEYEKTEKLL